jgi:lipopolysaccharide/colanic/teichoic acid biosynthesis glycosyltransferase
LREPKFKRQLDLFILAAAHVVLAPLWVLLWITIPLVIWLQDRGSVWYRQVRVGRHGQQFTLLKFRTMVPNADDIGPAWSSGNDTRVTPFGRILRRTALDELPQILSIVRGDMSFVGPKPLAVSEYDHLAEQIPNFSSRNAARPGLTGMAQVYNPDDDAWLKLEYDLQYIERMSLWLDAKLVILSVRNTLLGRWDRRGGKARQEQSFAPPRQETDDES